MKQLLKTSLTTGAGLAAVACLVAMPALQAEAVTVNANVRAVVGAAITLTTTSQGTSNNVDLNLTPGASAVLTSASDALTVNTNDSLGYTLTLADADTTYTLTSGGNTIAATANTTATPATLAVNTWGWALPGAPWDATYTVESNNTASTSKWAAIPTSASPYTLKSTSATATNDVTTVWYAAKVDSTKPTGTYTDGVVYTATAK